MKKPLMNDKQLQYEESYYMSESESEIEKIMPEILDISGEIYRLAELGSSELKSSQILADYLEKKGFKVEKPYAGMKTAFRATRNRGSPSVGFLAEYDALPNGHACGHNLIAAWAVGSAVLLSRMYDDISVTVLGTPSEEGIGEYAGSKAIMADRGYADGVDFYFGFHPDDQWGVGSGALADLTLDLEFIGKAAHGADSPEQGVNALDAAVTTYMAINNLRGWAKNDRHLVIGMIITQGGKATNVIPDVAEIQVEIRSTSSEFVGIFAEKVERTARSIAESYGASLECRRITPLYRDYLPNVRLDSILYEELLKVGLKPHNNHSSEYIPSGSTDEANISWVAPTGHLDMPIGYRGISGHSEEFRQAAEPFRNAENLRIAILATVRSALSASKHIQDIRDEYHAQRKHRGELQRD